MHQAGRMSQEDRAALCGSWNMVKSDKFEECLAAMGMSWFLRKMASMTSPTVHIQCEADTFTVKTVLPIKTQQQTFTLGQPFHVEEMGGVKMKVSPSWEEGAVMLRYEPEEEGKGKSFSIRRQVVDGQLVMTMCCNDVVCKRWFDKE